MSSFDREPMTSYWRSIVTMALSRVVSEIFNMEKYHDLEIAVKVIENGTIRQAVCGFLLVFCSNIAPKTHRFWDIRLVSIQWPWNPGYGSLKIIGTDTYRSTTYHFLLTFHSNHRPILYRFRDKWRFQLKISKFSHPVYFTPLLTEFP